MAYDPEQITFFAQTDARGKNIPFGIKAKDRTRHVYVIGKTGMGKSTLLENMAVQDIRNGNGIAFIDPHGQTAETILDYIPEERKQDVLYFAPFDTAHPVAFNVMEDVGPDRRHLVVSGLMSVFKKIWVDAWSARMEYILSNTLLALLEYPNSTLLGVNRMLSDKKYREMVVDNIKDPAVRSFWVDEFAKYNERYMQEAGDAIKNKIGQFTSNPLIRNIIGQPHSSFDIREIMDQRKILIMNLSKGMVGESNANLLGSMLTTRIYLAAMSRADLSVSELNAMPNFYFYVDEFQSFANATFADILSEARKYKLNLTIAHQYIEQMEEEVKNAVFGNVGTIISFRVGPFDAEVLETIYSPKFLAPDIVNLGFAQIYLTLMIDGIGSAPFSATTLPPIARPQVSCRDMVIHASREQFARERGVVEEEILEFHKPVTTPRPPRKETSEGGRNESNSNNNNRRDPNSNRSSNENTQRNSSDRRDDRSAKPRSDDRRSGPSRNDDSNDRSDRQEERSQRQDDRPRRSDDRPRKKENERPPAKSKEDQLAELRSVLQTITSSDELTEARSKEKNKPSADQNKQQDGSRAKGTPDPGLKDALKQALKNVVPSTEQDDQEKSNTASEQEKKEKTTQKPTNEELKAAQSVRTTESTPKQDDDDCGPPPQPMSADPFARTPRPAPEQSNQMVASQRSERDDALSPKKLERMMRVNGSDVSPL